MTRLSPVKCIICAISTAIHTKKTSNLGGQELAIPMANSIISDNVAAPI